MKAPLFIYIWAFLTEPKQIKKVLVSDSVYPSGSLVERDFLLFFDD